MLRRNKDSFYKDISIETKKERLQKEILMN